MARFERAIGTILIHEGGYTEDHAGPTNYGITLRALDVDINKDGLIDAADIRAMSVFDAIAFYRRWWERYRYGEIQSDDVAGKVFDLAVNMGPGQAHRLLQRAVNAAAIQYPVLVPAPLKADGVIGPVTIRAVNSLPPGTLTTELSDLAAGFYQALVAKRPEHSKYLTGWLRRARAVV